MRQINTLKRSVHTHLVSPALNLGQHLTRGLHTFGVRTDGVAAVEFALIFPLMISLYFGAVELGNGLLVNRKATNVASTASDLVAQVDINADIADVFAASSAILSPFDSSSIVITISSVVTELDGTTEVAWSDSMNGTPRAEGERISLPPGVATPGSSVIWAEVDYTYVSPIGKYLTGGITIEDDFYARPRRSIEVLRTP
jgi:Flp pilus assembly protein TadG